MTSLFSRPTLLATATGLLIACAASAQTAKGDADKTRELEVARAELDRAAKRYAELSRQNANFDREQFERDFERRFVQRPVLGVVLSPDPKSGVRIAAVTPDSAAAKAGLRSGDVLTAIEGKKLDQSEPEARLAEARRQLREMETGAPVTLAYLRDGRSATARATPQLGERVLMMRDVDGMPIARPLPIIAPQVRSELIRMDCSEDDDDCHMPLLADTFRWNGLNLASVDAQLGRYFGTDRGVLVLSTGPELAGLQAGDVIQSVDGKTVRSPRDVMSALRAKPAESRVAVGYLRDRKSTTTQVTVPKTAMLRIPRPPAPPAPPAAPQAPKAPPVPAAPKAPEPPQAFKPPVPPAPPAPPTAPPAPEFAVFVVM